MVGRGTGLCSDIQNQNKKVIFTKKQEKLTDTVINVLNTMQSEGRNEKVIQCDNMREIVTCRVDA